VFSSSSSTTSAAAASASCGSSTSRSAARCIGCPTAGAAGAASGSPGCAAAGCRLHHVTVAAAAAAVVVVVVHWAAAVEPRYGRGCRRTLRVVTRGWSAWRRDGCGRCVRCQPSAHWPALCLTRPGLAIHAHGPTSTQHSALTPARHTTAAGV
jgi:hypothetical protein